MRLIANMVCRNEGDRYLEEVLARLSGQVDLICFTDDNSTDNTVDIAWAAGAEVNCLKDESGESLFLQSESVVRSASWSHLSKHAEAGDWILAIDADEMFYYPDRDYLDTLLTQDRYTVLGVKFFHMWNDVEFRVDKHWEPNISSRLFKFYEGGKFRTSRLACGSEPTYVVSEIKARRFLTNTELSMKHLGYMRDEDKLAKHERYMTFDKGDFHALNHINSIIDPNPALEKWTLDE